jgi:hypothetical protein
MPIQAMPRIMYDRNGNVQEAQKLKGRACAIWTDLVSEVSRGGVKANQVIKRLEAGVTIDFMYWTDAYGQVNGTATIFVPGGQVAEEDCGGFLGIKTGYPANVYFFPTTTEDFKQPVPNTNLEGLLNTWHGSKKTVSWVTAGDYVAFDGIQYRIMGAGTGYVKYAFVKDNHLVCVCFFNSTLTFGTKIYAVSSLDANLALQVPAYTLEDGFNSLTKVISMSVSKSGKKLIVIGKDGNTPTSGYPVSLPAITGSGVGGLKLSMPTFIQALASHLPATLWYTVSNWDVDTIATGYYDVMLQGDSENLFKKHIYRTNQHSDIGYTNNHHTVNSSGYSKLETWDVSYQVISTESYTAMYNTTQKLLVSFNGEVAEFTTFTSAMTGEYSSEYHQEAAQSFDFSSAGAGQPLLETTTDNYSEITVITDDRNFSVTITHKAQTIVESFSQVWNQTNSYSNQKPINRDAVNVVFGLIRDEVITYTADVLKKETIKISGINPYVSDYSAIFKQNTLNDLSTGLQNSITYPGDYIGIDVTESEVYFDRDRATDQKSFVNYHNIFSLTFPNSAPTSTANFGILGNVVNANGSVSDINVSTGIFYGTSSIDTNSFSPAVVTDGGAYFYISPSYEIANFVKDQIESNDLVLNLADKCGNMLYTLDSYGYGTTARQTGAKALEKDFSLSSKNSTIAGILDIPADMTGVV